MKKITAILLSLLMLISLAACGQKEVAPVPMEQEKETTTEESAPEMAKEVIIEEVGIEPEISRYPLTITDKFGNEVVIEAAPETIISMSPELTEIIFALGAGNLMIGRSSYCNFPAETESVEDFGTLFDLNIESIVAVQPDVIFLSSMASEELVTTLMDQGLTVVTFDKDSNLDGTYAYMTSVGDVIDRVEEATVLSEEIKVRIAEVASKTAGAETPTVYYVVYAGDGYDSTATGDTFIHDMLQTAGGDNVAKEGANWSYSVETLVEQDPWMIFCSINDGSKAKIQALEGYKELTAVKEDRLYEVDPDIFSRQGPRVGEAVEVLARLIHPEMFN